MVRAYTETAAQGFVPPLCYPELPIVSSDGSIDDSCLQTTLVAFWYPTHGTPSSITAIGKATLGLRISGSISPRRTCHPQCGALFPFASCLRVSRASQCISTISSPRPSAFLDGVLLLRRSRPHCPRLHVRLLGNMGFWTPRTMREKHRPLRPLAAPPIQDKPAHESSRDPWPYARCLDHTGGPL